MIALTTNITISNLTRVGVLDVLFDEDLGTALVKLEAKTSTGNGDIRYDTWVVAVVDGAGTPATASQKLMKNPSPTNIFRDALIVVNQINIPNGFTNLRSAWYGAANNKGARRAAAETAGLSAGWIDSTLTGTVS